MPDFTKMSKTNKLLLISGVLIFFILVTGYVIYAMMHTEDEDELFE